MMERYVEESAVGPVSSEPVRASLAANAANAANGGFDPPSSFIPKIDETGVVQIWKTSSVKPFGQGPT